MPVVVLRCLRSKAPTGRATAMSPTTWKRSSRRGSLTRCDFVDDDHPLRQPWASASGVRELLRWASGHVDLTGRPDQRKTWNLSGLFRLPTADGPVWLKAVPAFAAAEPAAIAAFAQVDPDLVPAVLARAPGRLLLADIPGADCWEASPQVVADAVHRLATAQARIGPPPDGIPDRRPQTLAAAVHDLLEGPVGSRAKPQGTGRRQEPAVAVEMLADCGLPDTVVHGDFHPGNWRRDDGRPGHPRLRRRAPGQSGARRAARDRLPAGSASRRGGRRLDRGLDRRGPPVAPGQALRIAEPLAHLAYAVRYQEFLDNIEPSERVYHLGDPAASVRAAITCASALDGG